MKLIAALVLGSFMVGCVSAPPNLDTSKPVEFSHSMWEPSLRQNGVVINEITAMDEFSKISAAESAAGSAKALFWTGVIAAGVGGWFLGTGLASKDNQGQNLGISVGFIGLSFLLAHFQKNSLGEAVEQYNSNFKTQKPAGKKSGYKIEPAIAPVAGGAIGGFSWFF